MSTSKLVSIIIPSYNMAAYLREAVDSALAQTYRSIEIIVVDDGSTDDTKRIVEPYIRDKKIIYIHQANKGLAGARNTGIKNAHGAYIAFLDADDLFAPEKIAEQVSALEKNPEFGVCYSDLTHFTDPPSPRLRRAGTTPRVFYHHRYRYPSGDLFEPLLHRQFINPLAVLFRRDVCESYGVFDETLRRSEDWDLWLRWAHAGVRFLYLDKPLAFYRIRSIGNLSSIASEPEMKEKNFFIFSRIGKQLTPAERTRYHFDSILRKLLIKTAFAYLMVGNKTAALRWAEETPGIRLLILILPAGAWKMLFGFARSLKHRLLLKKI